MELKHFEFHLNIVITWNLFKMMETLKYLQI